MGGRSGWVKKFSGNHLGMANWRGHIVAAILRRSIHAVRKRGGDHLEKGLTSKGGVILTEARCLDKGKR